MKIGINLLCLSGHISDGNLPQIERVKSVGFDGIEVPIFQPDQKYYHALGKRIADIGLQCTCSTALPDGEHSAGLLSDNKGTRQFAIDRLKGVIDSAAALGADIVCGPMVSAVGYFSGVQRQPLEWERGVSAHQDLARHAAGAGITLAFEPLNRFETYFLNTMEDGAAFAGAVGHPALTILYDSFHANIEEKDPIAAYNFAREHIGHVHIAENDRGIPGQGHIDFAALFQTLKSTKYDGWLTIEAFSQSLPELAAATRIWRPLYKDFETLASQGYEFVHRSWLEAVK